MSNEVDLTQDNAAYLQNTLFQTVKDLHRGESVVIRTSCDPEQAVKTANLHLRDNLTWSTEELGNGAWRVTVKHRFDVEPKDIVDVLTRDHKRLDDLFARALHNVNQGDVAAAKPLLLEFAEGLRRHIDVEDHLLTGSFNAPRDPFGGDPTSTMLREHQEILGNTALIESYFEGDELPAVSDVSPFFAIMSGTLAKHEFREETNLFPNWYGALQKAPPEAAAALLQKVQSILAGETTAAGV